MMIQRAAIYVRTASIEQHTNNLQSQLEQNTRYIHQKGYVLTNTFTDVGSGNKLDHPGLHELLSLAKNNAIDLVIVTSFDRLSRKLHQLQEIMQKLEKHNVTVECSQGTPLMNFTYLEKDEIRLRTNALLHKDNSRRAISQWHKKPPTTNKG